MMVFRSEISSWAASTLAALVLHLALLFALVEQMKAGIARKSETEISILSLPSMSTSTTAKPTELQVIKPDIVSNTEDVQTINRERIVQQPLNATAPEQDKDIRKIDAPKPDQLAAIISDADSLKTTAGKNATSLQQTRDMERIDRISPDGSKKSASQSWEQANRTVATAQTTKNIKDHQRKTAVAKNIFAAVIPEKQKTRFKKPQIEIASPLVQPKTTKPAKPRNVKRAKSTSPLVVASSSKPGTATTVVSRLRVEAPPPERPKAEVLKRKNVSSAALDVVPSRVVTRPAAKTKTQPTVNKAQPSKIVTSNTQATKPSRFSKQAKVKQTRIETAPVKSVRNINRILTKSVLPMLSRGQAQPDAVHLKRPEHKPVLVASITVKAAQRVRPTALKASAPDKNLPVQNEFAFLTPPKIDFSVITSVNAQLLGKKLNQVVKTLATQDVDSCFFAYPNVTYDNRLELVGFSRTKNLWPGFLNNIKQDKDFLLPTKFTAITDDQCQAVNFAQSKHDSSANSLSIVLKNGNILSGQFLEGKLLNVNNRHLVLLLVDDGGAVQNLTSLVSDLDDGPQFSLQMNAAASFANTAQLLLAIISDKPLDSSGFTTVMAITELLANIEQEVKAERLKIDVAISAFTIR